MNAGRMEQSRQNGAWRRAESRLLNAELKSLLFGLRRNKYGSGGAAGEAAMRGLLFELMF
jgi:hypothetical protein